MTFPEIAHTVRSKASFQGMSWRAQLVRTVFPDFPLAMYLSRSATYAVLFVVESCFLVLLVVSRQEPLLFSAGQKKLKAACPQDGAGRA